MLIAASCAFLVFNIPFDVYFLGYYFGALGGVTDLSRKIFYRVASILSYTNHSVNFFLYFASGSKFRAAFISTFLACRRRHEVANSGGRQIQTVSDVVSCHAPPQQSAVTVD